MEQFHTIVKLDPNMHTHYIQISIHQLIKGNIESLQLLLTRYNSGSWLECVEKLFCGDNLPNDHFFILNGNELIIQEHFIPHNCSNRWIYTHLILVSQLSIVILHNIPIFTALQGFL